MSDFVSPKLYPDSPALRREPQGHPLPGPDRFNDPAFAALEKVLKAPRDTSATGLGPLDYSEADDEVFDIVGADAFQRGRAAARKKIYGLPTTPEDEAALDELTRGYGVATSRTLLATSMGIAQADGEGLTGKVVKQAAGFLDSVVSTVPQALYGVASLFSDDAAPALNSMLGLKGSESPRVGFYMEALDRWLSDRSDMPLSAHYRQVATQERTRQGQLDPGSALVQQTAEQVGALYGVFGKTLAPVSKGFDALGKVPLLGKVSHSANKWAATRASGIGRFLATSVAHGMVPGARLGVWEGITRYTDENGYPLDGVERLTHGLATAAMMPVFSAFAILGAQAAAGIRRDGAVVTSAFSQWLRGLSPQSFRGIPAGEEAGATLWGRFVQDGMPGVSASWRRQALAEITQTVIEGAGFSAADSEFWGDIIDSIEEGKAPTAALESLSRNTLMVGMLRWGGSVRAMQARSHERAMERIAPPPEAPKVEASEPARSVTKTEEPGKVPEPYSFEREIEAAEKWLDVQTHPAVEADLLINRAVAEASKESDPGAIDTWLRYAANVARWRDEGIEGPRPKAQLPKVREWEQDILDRRSRVSARAAEQARNVEAGREPNEPAPRRVTPLDLRRVAEGLGGRVQEPRKRAARDRAEPTPRAEPKEPAKPKRPTEDPRPDAKQELPDPYRGAEAEYAVDVLRAIRDREIAEAKMALEGIGAETAAEAVRLVPARGKGKPFLITYQQGGFWKKPVNDGEWKPMPTKQALALAVESRRAAIEAEQVATTDRIAARALELRDSMPEHEMELLGTILKMVQGVSASQSPSVAAALELAKLMPPSQWQLQHFAMFAQMALRGISAETQQAIVEAFAREGERVRAEQQQRQAEASEAEKTTPQDAPGSTETTRPDQQSRAEPQAAEGPSKRLVEPREIAARLLGSKEMADALPDAEIRRMLADEGIEVDPESGRADLGSVAAVTGIGAAVAASIAGVYADAGGALTFLPALAGAAMTLPWLYRNLGKMISERLRDVGGDQALAREIEVASNEVRSRTDEILRGLNTMVLRAKKLADESPFTKKGRALRRAKHSLAKVRWDSNAPTAGGDDGFITYADGRQPIPADAPPEVVALLDTFRNVMNAANPFFARYRPALRTASGELVRTKFREDKRILVRMPSSDLLDILHRPGSPQWEALRTILAQRNSTTLEQADAQLRILRQVEAHGRGAFERARVAQNFPSHMRFEGRELTLLETWPEVYAARYAVRTADRLAKLSVFGQEAMKVEDTNTIPQVSVGLRRSLIDPTPEQVRLNEVMEQFIESARDKEMATRLLVKNMRALDGIQPSLPMDSLGDIDLGPGSGVHAFVRDFIGPAQTIWKHFKLSAAFVPNAPEALGTPATLLGTGTMARALAKAYFTAIVNPKKYRRTVLRMAARGTTDAVVPQFGAMSRAPRPGRRGADIASLASPLSMPMRVVNQVGDLAANFAVAEIVARSKQAGGLRGEDRANILGAMRLLDFTPEQATAVVDGKASPELIRDFERRVGRDVYGKRTRQSQSLLQSSRTFQFWTAFTSWTAANLRMNVRIGKEMGEAIVSRTMPLAERLRRVARVFRHAANKSASHAMAFMAYNFLFFGKHLFQMFDGDSDEQDRENFVKNFGLYMLAAELGGPVVGVLVAAATGRDGQRSVADALVQTTPLGAIGKDVYDFSFGVGHYKNRRTGIAGIPDSLVSVAINNAPLLRAMDTLAHAPENAVAVRRYYEVFPSNRRVTQEEHVKFSAALGRVIERVRRAGADFSKMADGDIDVIRRDIIEALRAPHEDPVRERELQAMPEADRLKESKKRVLASLAERRFLKGKDEAHQAEFIQKAGIENARALIRIDDAIEQLRDMVKRSY